MNVRLQRKIKISNNIYINVSKNSISLSIKILRGITVNLGKNSRVNASIPGTGISFSQNLKK